MSDNRERLRVLLVSHTCQTRTHGQAKAERIAAAEDIQLHVVVPDRWRDDYDNWREPAAPLGGRFTFEASTVRWPHVGPFKRYLHWYPQLGSVLRRLRPHVIDIWEESWGLVSAHITRLRNRILPDTRIITETEQNIEKVLPFPFERFRRYTLQNADFAIARSKEAMNVLRAKGYAGPGEVIPNALDARLFRPMDREACRRAVGVEGFTIGFTGRLIEEKGLMDLVNALPQCDPAVRLLFVGEGPFLPALEARVDEYNLRGRVTFLPLRAIEDLPEVMNAIDVLVLPSRTTASWKEQFGRVIIEAHACRTPVIGSDSGAIPEVVGLGGTIFPEGDPRALARAINHLRDNPVVLAQYAEAGYREVLRSYTWERVAERMQGIYRRVAAGNAARLLGADDLDSRPLGTTA